MQHGVDELPSARSPQLPPSAAHVSHVFTDGHSGGAGAHTDRVASGGGQAGGAAPRCVTVCVTVCNVYVCACLRLSCAVPLNCFWC